MNVYTFFRGEGDLCEVGIVLDPLCVVYSGQLFILLICRCGLSNDTDPICYENLHLLRLIYRSGFLRQISFIYVHV